MDEPLEPPAKKTCSRHWNDADPKPKVKVLSGQIFIRMRKALNEKCFLLDRNAVDENDLSISTEAWLEQEVDNFSKVWRIGTRS